jgi:intracellular multiplication protein IcmO
MAQKKKKYIGIDTKNEKNYKTDTRTSATKIYQAITRTDDRILQHPFKKDTPLKNIFNGKPIDIPFAARLIIIASFIPFILILLNETTIFWPIVFLFNFIIYFLYATNRKIVSFQTPKSNSKDGEGISYFGNEQSDQAEVWFNDSELRTHCLIMGTTGAGKTESLLSIASNSLIHGSGMVYVDGKADSSLWAKIYSMTAAFGRLDDLYILNYMKGSVDFDDPTENLMTNTLNPFGAGTADNIAGLISSIAITDKGMWSDRASAFINAMCTLACHLRDKGEILLSASTLRSFLELDHLINTCNRDDIPKQYKEPMSAFLMSLAGILTQRINGKLIFLPANKQGDKTTEQFGYISMQLTKAFSLFSDEYKHITKAVISEIDFYDIVVNRRILVVLIPALEKDPTTTQILGRLVIASIKQLMATTLGAQVDGSVKEVIEKKPTNSRAPFTTIFDEYGYYAVEGAAVMPAQARSLGFSMIFAGQDYQAFKKGSAEEAASIVANCGTKICMKLEDTDETLKLFLEAAGKSNTVLDTSMERKDGDLLKSQSTSIQWNDIIDVRDLKGQAAGEAHVIQGSKLRRIQMYYAAPKPLKNTQVNSFIEVRPPDFFKVKSMEQSFIELSQTFKRISDPITADKEEKEIEEKLFNIKKFNHNNTLDTFIHNFNSMKSQIETMNKNRSEKYQIDIKNAAGLAVFKQVMVNNIEDEYLIDSLASNDDFDLEISADELNETIENVEFSEVNEEDLREIA